MPNLIRHVLCAMVLLASAPVLAQGAASAPAGTPPGFTAPAPPKPDESNAERARSQPGNNAPFWRGVHDSGDNAGFTTQEGSERGVLVQKFVQYPGSSYTNAGEAWRQVRNRVIVPYGAALIVIALLAVALFYFYRGPIGEPMAERGRVIERFTPFERAAHWANAIAFVALAVSGLVMAFGRILLLPWMGGTLFGWLTYGLKTLHNFMGPLFVVSLIVVIFTFVRDELPRPGDAEWLRRFGGMFSGQEVPSHRFNAGEKVLFWIGVMVLGLIVAASGLVLDKLIPDLAYTRGGMQVAHMVHAVSSILMMALFIGHIYLGSIGLGGAYTAMRHGWVTEHWAKEHHGFWADDVRAGKIPAQRSAPASPEPAELPH